MSATTSAADKYLFLFTTDSDNLDPVKNALQNYYKFPAANTYAATGCQNFKSTFKLLAEALAGTDPLIPVYKLPDGAGLVPAGETNMNTVFIVISGEADSTGLFDLAANTLTWQEIIQTINGFMPQPSGPPKQYPYQQYAEVHVIFASPYCNVFVSEWDLSTPVTNGTMIVPATVSDAISQVQREAFLSGYADHLCLNTGVTIDNEGRISMNDIAAAVHGASVAGYFRSVGSGTSGKYFAGYSRLEIDDGTPWWESPDIYINTPGNDLYDQDANNNCYIKVHARGTHPVKGFSLGAKHFGTGLGTTDALVVANPHVPDATLPLVLKGGETCTHTYQLMFLSTTTHRCICARASFIPVVSTDIDDYSEWSIVSNANEAQRNIDPAPAGPPPPPPLPLPEPDPAQNPDPDPAPSGDDQNNTGDRSLANIRGFKERIYSILNPYKERRIFRIALYKEFQKYSNIVKVDFFRIKEGDTRSISRLKINTSPYNYVNLVLDSGQKQDILVRINVIDSSAFRKELRLPLEFLVEKKRNAGLLLRKTLITKLDSAYVSIGGVTIKTWPMKLTISGIVSDREGKPVAGACLQIRSVNGLQAAVLKSDRKGRYIMKDINPDAYRMRAYTREWSTGYKIINLYKRNMSVDFRKP
ncbi:MAG: carboxypeptidase-like regulatory domain-containing protein [Bacteroidales bacterium]